MQIAWSASRTCIASASAVECTATVSMPISCAARWMRSAISPRLAISRRVIGTTSANDDQRVVVFDRLGVLDQDLLDGAVLGGGDRVHHLHRFDDQQRVAGLHLAADLDERIGARLGEEIGG